MTFALKRLSSSLLAIGGAVTLLFFILYWLPGDPAELVAGQDATASTIERVRLQLGTNRPIGQQFLAYVVGLAHGDLGRSFSTKEPVLDRLRSQLPSTLGLTVGATAVMVLVGVALGIASAVYHRRSVDHLIAVLTLGLTSMPPFWLGILLILSFSVVLHWLPSIGNGSLAQLVLPATSLGLVASGSLARMIRGAILDVRGEPFVLTLRAKGLSGRAILLRHVLRNALIPAVTLVGILFGELLAGVAVAETLFARQGLGRLVVEAIGQKDIPMLQGAVLCASVFYVLINLLVDLSYARIDPRLRE
jgi:ABC-type dipeptide/oligopeptide/nickel transport system permease component